MVPDGAKKVRAWIAYPTDDPQQVVTAMKIDSPYPTRVETDADGNKILYVEAMNPGVKEFVVAQNFRLDRREQKVVADATKTRALTDAERVANAAPWAGALWGFEAQRRSAVPNAFECQNAVGLRTTNSAVSCARYRAGLRVRRCCRECEAGDDQ